MKAPEKVKAPEMMGGAAARLPITSPEVPTARTTAIALHGLTNTGGQLLLCGARGRPARSVRRRAMVSRP